MKTKELLKTSLLGQLVLKIKRSKRVSRDVLREFGKRAFGYDMATIDRKLRILTERRYIFAIKNDKGFITHYKSI